MDLEQNSKGFWIEREVNEVLTVITSIYEALSWA